MRQIELVRRVIEVLESMDVTYMVVGSYASGAMGEPRFTQDADIVVKLLAEDVAALCRAFPAPEYYLDETSALGAIRADGSFNLIHPTSGNKVDFFPARNDAWGRQQIANRQRVRLFEGFDAFAAKPEDIILSKMLYYREGGSDKHLRDITGVLKMQAASIDRNYIARWASELSVTDIWQAILRRLTK